MTSMTAAHSYSQCEEENKNSKIIAQALYEVFTPPQLFKTILPQNFNIKIH